MIYKGLWRKDGDEWVMGELLEFPSDPILEKLCPGDYRHVYIISENGDMFDVHPESVIEVK